MKKTIKRPDGTEETIEGTAEELAEFERKKTGEVKEEKKPAKRDILKGSPVVPVPVCPLVPNHAPLPLIPPIRWEHDPNCEIVRAQNGWWSVVPPRCTCGLITYPVTRYHPYTYTSADVKFHGDKTWAWDGVTTAS